MDAKSILTIPVKPPKTLTPFSVVRIDSTAKYLELGSSGGAPNAVIDGGSFLTDNAFVDGGSFV